MKTSFQRESCRRLGKPLSFRIQPLLVTLDSQSSVADLLCSAPALRHCDKLEIKNSVFINADLTPAEALAAYEKRVQRREKKLKGIDNQRPMAGATNSSLKVDGLPPGI